MRLLRRDDAAVAEEAAAAARRVRENLPTVAKGVRDTIAELVPALAGDERIEELLLASVHENLDAALHALQHDLHVAVAPSAAIEHARRLAEGEVGLAALIRAYRVGQTRFQRDCIDEMLRGRGGDHVEGAAARRIVEVTSAHADQVIEQIVEVYERTREEMLHHRNAIFVQQVRRLLRGGAIDPDEAQALLREYVVDQHHLAAVVWSTGTLANSSSLSDLHQYALELGRAAECRDAPLFVPYDEHTAWLWLPLGKDRTFDIERLRDHVYAADAVVSVGVGEAMAGLSGFRRSHRQAQLAYNVAIAARPALAPLTAFTDIAPISMMAADLEAARTWTFETLGALAVDDERAAMLRETARVFLANGGSFTATASHMMLHRNTVQYRVRRAEDIRGRPLREGRLDVELALLACHFFGSAVLHPLPPEADHELAKALLS